ncbi:4'-phosphopantetheinyl transferase superfamily protein [Streptomyces sp. CHD11]|uniref:4'-phosphopantetheinyl transferase family protein n=1 Tax=Streptomyces sp. CHD11 TaxID=2741325 RepID=UPI001BFC4198|nr:4'-phosphopantetheinyl transferase superfamily protein [Streptomyces sp. CHD11]MBT3154305.1 4'-phosphopantetheinyl transferase superfamily protein [Streptomyces sp. CHD11]
MIEELLPSTVLTVEAYGDEGVDAPLYPEEEAVVRRAVLKRRREFTAVRVCARRAMEKLGVAPGPVLPDERGAPLWPEGLAGSMTHCQGYCAAALVRVGELASVGIDAEPHAALPEGVLTAVALPGEVARIARLSGEVPGVHFDRLLFSAKESVYKAWYPLTGKWLDFMEADLEFQVEDGEGTRGAFRATLLVDGPVVGGRGVNVFTGRWTARQGLIATAVTVALAG